MRTKATSVTANGLGVLAAALAMGAGSHAYAATTAGDLLISNRQATTVSIANPSAPSQGVNQFASVNNPYYITMGPDGNIYAAQVSNDDVAVITPNATYSSGTVTSTISLPGGAQPTGVAFGNGFLFVTDRSHEAVYRFLATPNASGGLTFTNDGMNGSTSSPLFVSIAGISGSVNGANGIVDYNGNLYFTVEGGTGYNGNNGGGIYEISATGAGSSGLMADVALADATGVAVGRGAGGATDLYVGTAYNQTGNYGPTATGDQIYTTNLFTSAMTATTPTLFADREVANSAGGGNGAQVGVFGLAFGPQDGVLYADNYDNGNHGLSEISSFNPNVSTGATPTVLLTNANGLQNSSLGIVVVPEPASLSLIGLGGFVLLGGRRRRQI